MCFKTVILCSYYIENCIRFGSVLVNCQVQAIKLSYLRFVPPFCFHHKCNIIIHESVRRNDKVGGFVCFI